MRPDTQQHRRRFGFTLTELLVSIAIFSLATAGALSVYFTCARCYWSTDVKTRAARISAMSVQKLIYGVNGSNGVRTAISTNIVVSQTNGPWSLSYFVPDGTSNHFYFVPSNQCILYVNSTLSNSVCTVATHVAVSSIANSSNGLSVSVCGLVQEGRFVASNTISTYIQYRN